jgi:hypothetical protein
MSFSTLYFYNYVNLFELDSPFSNFHINSVNAP